MLFTIIKLRKSVRKDKSFASQAAIIKYGLFFAAIVFSLCFYSCRRPPTVEMRSLLPNNAVAYLETKDLAKTLGAMTESRAFQELAAKQPDFSALENMPLAVAITSFETTEENSVLNFRPKFVAVAETHAWSWQTVSFAENQLDRFVRQNYGADAKLETADKNGGKFFSWQAADNRQVFAFTLGSLIYFGTDAAAIESVSTIQNGAPESLLKNESLSRAFSPNNLAFGYVSPEGIRQIAALAGVSAAVKTTEEESGRVFISRVLPQILQNSVTEIVWTANRSERGVEDKFSVSLNGEIAAVTKENLASAQPTTSNSGEFLPPEFYSATRYNLKNPLAAWQSLLLIAAKNADPLSGRILVEYSNRLLEPYGISNAEQFLNSIDSEIVTAQFDADGEKSAAIVRVKDRKKTKESITPEINFKNPPETRLNAEIWFSENKQFATAFIENKLILGESESVLKCLEAKASNQNWAQNPNLLKITASQSAAATCAIDSDTAGKVAAVLAGKKNPDRQLATFYSTETRFTETGIERTTVSDYGLIGTILSQIESRKQ